MSDIRANIHVGGIVQGVGFRPFIHRQITGYGLKGWIRNTSQGAELEIEGPEEDVDSFVRTLSARSPKLALISYVHVTRYGDLKGYEDFSIIESRSDVQRNTLISPDVCICPACLQEMRDPSNRRYRYPFINCTDCGPRFTIIRDVPYDRRCTTMSEFEMCPDCRREYTDINDRRYHAEPTACPVCGPKLLYYKADGTPAEGDPIELAKADIRAGRIVAVKGLGGVHLAALPDDPEQVRELRRRKHRDEKPFALMCRDAEAAARYCRITDAEREALEGFRRPIVLLRKKDPSVLPYVSSNQYIGVMLPYTPVHYLLMDDGIDALIMTSANLSDLPIIYKNDEALDKLSGIADGFLLNDREIHVRCDDSLIYMLGSREYPLRRSRGYVPYPVLMDRQLPPILACGAEQKASFCLSKGDCVFPSQHIGDLKNIETYDNYADQTDHFRRMYDITPEAVACDLHPDYMSTGYAEEYAQREGIPLIRVQHHHAHMASCMADNGLDGECIGIIWDGTGYGTDGTIWGGEFLTGGYSDFTRSGHLLGIRLPGGDRAMEEIWRTGISMMLAAGAGPEEIYPVDKITIIDKMIARGYNVPVSSGMGRLFDGAASIMGIRDTVSYEGQGAVLLEAAADETVTDGYEFPLTETEDGLVMDWRPAVRAMAADRRDGVSCGIMAAKFMNGLCSAAVQMCVRIRENTGLDRTVLSGGTFQNMYMMKRLPAMLEAAGFACYTHSRVSANDEGISLGQLMIAERRSRL